MVTMIVKDSNVRLKTIERLSMKANALTETEKILFKECYLVLGFETLLTYSKQKKIVPFVAKCCIDMGLSISSWKEHYNFYEIRNSDIIKILEAIFRKFSSEGINQVFVYENFGALLMSNTSVGCFASGDVDLYADYSVKKDISRVLKSEGFLPQKSNELTETVKTEFLNSELFTTGFGINVMWRPLSRLKLPFPIKINTCINWDELVAYNQSKVLLPNVDALMYLCLLHISIHGFHRSPDIRLYTDTDRVALKKPDWDRIALFAKKDNTEVRTAAAAILTSKLLGMTLPDNWSLQYIRKYKKINWLLKRVYDLEKNFLLEEPGGFSVLLIEILSSDSNVAKAILDILFPHKKWIMEYYLQGKGSLIKGYFMHFKNLI
jgi:hypothetical protein